MMDAASHSWLPKTSCTADCVRSRQGKADRCILVAARVALRIGIVATVLTMLPILALSLPGQRNGARVLFMLRGALCRPRRRTRPDYAGEAVGNAAGLNAGTSLPILARAWPWPVAWKMTRRDICTAWSAKRS